jgi:hypothetical protein
MNLSVEPANCVLIRSWEDLLVVPGREVALGLLAAAARALVHRGLGGRFANPPAGHQEAALGSDR